MQLQYQPLEKSCWNTEKNKKAARVSGNKIIIIIPYPYPYHILLYSWGQTDPPTFVGPRNLHLFVRTSSSPSAPLYLRHSEERPQWDLWILLLVICASAAGVSVCAHTLWSERSEPKTTQDDNYKVLKLICVENLHTSLDLCLLCVPFGDFPRKTYEKYSVVGHCWSGKPEGAQCKSKNLTHELNSSRLTDLSEMIPGRSVRRDAWRDWNVFKSLLLTILDTVQKK